MPDEFDPKEWLTTSEAAELTGYTTRYFRKAVSKGRLHGIKRGRDWFLSKKEVLAYAEEMRRLGPRKHDPWRTGAREKEESGAE
jgi:excisionase family DNA binding protein